MKFKKIFTILLLLTVFMCCASAVSAVSDDTISDDSLSIGQDTDVASVAIDEEISASETEQVAAQDSANGEKLTAEAADNRSPYEKFSDDLIDNEGTIYLEGDIKISKPFDTIKEKTVIDGKGHTIDAQGKTNIFNVYQTTLTLKNIILKNAKSASNGKGGAIYCSNGNLNIDHCQFINNHATEYGGAIAILHGKLTVTNSQFTGNKVETSKKTGYGGAIWLLDSSSSIKNSVFKSNQVIAKSLKKHSQATKFKFNGGAISYSSGSTHELIGCKFTKNKASNHGGSLFVFKSKSLKIKKSTFDSNRAGYEDGGAVSFAGQKLTVSDSHFTNNLAYEDGGAMDTYSLTGKKIRITIKNTEFKSNTAYKGAGAIWMGVKTVYKIENSKFIKNKASLAGALVAEDGSAEITKCTFTSNKAGKVTSWTVKTKAGGKLNHCGGAISIQKCNIKILKNKFTKNKATMGGAIHYVAGKLTLKKNTITGNKASKYGTQFFANNPVKLNNNNKWGPKKLTTKKAIKVKNMFGGKVKA